MVRCELTSLPAPLRRLIEFDSVPGLWEAWKSRSNAECDLRAYGNGDHPTWFRFWSDDVRSPDGSFWWKFEEHDGKWSVMSRGNVDMPLRAFLAMPFRPELRWIREAIRRATIELGVELRATDERLAPGDEIVAGIRQEIRECSLAYVVLTDLNPNVMYELGLLHEASKPTILLADKQSVSKLPFDIQTRMVVTFEGGAAASDDLVQAVITATGRLLALFERATRQELVTDAAGPTTQSFHQVQLSSSQFDWEKLKNDGARAVGRKGCTTNNISPHDDGDFKGWRLKARCSGGDTIYVYVDINGDVSSVDVQ